MDFEGLGIFGEHTEILFGDMLPYLFTLCRIGEGDAGALETSSTEATAIDAIGLTHDIIDGYQLFTATLIVLDTALAALEAELTEEGQVACFPCGDALTHALVLTIEMLGTAGKAGRHLLTGEVVSFLGYIAKEGLVQRAERHTGIGHHIPCSGFALGHTKIVVAINEAAGETAEDDGKVELRHAGIPANDTILLTVGIEEEQGILLTEGDTRLVKDTVVESYIFALSLTGNLHHLHRGKGDVIGFGKSHDIGDEHSCAR